MSGTSSGSVAVTGESSSGGRSLPVNLLGSGSGASSGGQASACAGEEDLVYLQIQEIVFIFPSFCSGLIITWSSRAV